MKKIIFLLLFTIVGWQQAQAQQFSYNGLMFNVTSGTTVAVANQNGAVSGNVEIPSVAAFSNGFFVQYYDVTSISESAFENCSNLTTITIPNTVSSVGNQAFFACVNLQSLTFPNAVTSIGARTFGYCFELTSVTIPDAVTSIGEYAFTFCFKLASVTIPSALDSIGEGAFNNCTGLTAVTSNRTTPLGIDATIFEGVNQGACSLTVPYGRVAAYEAAAFWQIFSPITAAPCTPTDNTTNVTVCGSYTWANNGETYTTSGVYTGTTTNCITEKLDLTITTPPTSFTFNNLNYVVTGTNTVAVGSNPNANGDVTIPASVTTDCGTYAVTSIGFGAFDSCYGLNTITIPNSVTSIDDYAFANCYNLSSVICEIANPLPINQNVFAGLYQGYISLKVPSTSVSLYQGAPVWQNFSPITCLNGTENITYIAACGSYTWGNTGQTYTYSGLITGTTTNCVTQKLNLTITSNPSSFTFEGINYQVTSENTASVVNSPSASGNVVIPATVGVDCFTYSITNINSNAFLSNTTLTSITIPDTVTIIEGDAFKECTSLTSVIIGNSVTSIGGYAFIGCTQLNSLTIGNAVTTISDGVFANCYSLTTLTIPSSVTSIGGSAFLDCYSLTSVSVSRTSPLSINANVFAGVNQSACILTVPVGSEAAYKSAPVWMNFAPIVDQNTTIWNGTAWSKGIPDATKSALFTGNYSEPTVLNAMSLEVKGTAIVTVPSGFNYTVSGKVTVAATASLTFENNANLIQSGTTNDNTGNITIKRDSNLLKRLDYTMWSSPVTGSQTLLNFSPLTSAAAPVRFYTYNPTSNLYTAATVGNPFDIATGYLIRMPNENPAERGLDSNYYKGIDPLIYTGSFTGKPNNGTITLNGLTSGNYYGVGNPYPSTLSADLFLSGNSTAGTLYFWRKTNGVSGTAYATYTSAGGVGTGPGNGGLGNPNGTIQVGQGFIVKTTGTSLSFTNAMRETAPSSTQFFKTKKVADKSRVWLSLSDAKGGLNQAMIAYIDGATTGVDSGYDGKYFNDSKIALTSTIDSEEYVIQARPSFVATDAVALGFKTDVAGDYSIALDSFDGVFASGQDVYLVDAVAGKEIDLKAGAYTFTATAGVDNARFSLKYQKTLKVDAPAFNENSVKVYKNNGLIYVNSTAKAIKTIAVYDVQGRLIAQQKNVNATTATISNLKAISQVLIVKISADDNSVVSKKVLN